MKRLYRAIIFALLFLMLAGLFTACAQQEKAHDPDAVASVNGVDITISQIDERAKINEIRNKAYTDTFQEAYGKEAEQKLQEYQVIAATDRDGVLKELIEA